MAGTKERGEPSGAALAAAGSGHGCGPAWRRRVAGVGLAALWGAVGVASGAGAPLPPRFTGPWDMTALRQTPAATWGAVSNNLRRVYYDSVPYQGHATRVFAYYAWPTNGTPPYPAVVLVPGSGMGAVADWVEFWAGRGYAALTMDLAGRDPDGPLPDSGPDQTEASMFGDFTDQEAQQMWFYHAAAAVVRGYSLLAAQPEVDKQRVGVHGLSSGGVVTCIVAGIDERVAAAAVGFGAGYLYEDCAWGYSFQVMTAAQRARWIKCFDPASYLGGVSCPILFVSGVTDPYFPPNSFQHSYQTVRTNATLSLRATLSHGWIWAIPGADTEVNRFLDTVLKQGPPMARLSALRREGDVVSITYSSEVIAWYARLNYTTDLGPWQKRIWRQEYASLSRSSVTARLPSERPLEYYLSLTDAKGATVSTPRFSADYEFKPAVLRITAIQQLEPGRLVVRGTKALNHRLLLQGAVNGSFWYEVARDTRLGESFECTIANEAVNGILLLQMRDLDW